MFCKKCGNEMADGENFCRKCGSSIDQNEKSATNKSGAKKNNNLILRICIIAAAFLIGRFAIAPIITNSYQDNGDSGAVQTEYNGNVADRQQAVGNVSYDGTLKTNVYSSVSEGIFSSEVYVMYSDGDMSMHKDGAVVSVTGNMIAFDTESDAAKDFARIQKGIEETVTNSGISNVSYRLTENSSSYSVQFSFNDLDGDERSEAATLASRMLFGDNGSTNDISSIHRELLALDYTLVNEY